MNATTYRRLLSIWLSLTLCIASSLAVQAQLLPPKQKTPPAKATPADEPKERDLQKEVEDALKRIEKLDKAAPGAVREEVRPQILKVNPAATVRAVGTAYTMGLQLRPLPPLLVEHLNIPANQGLLINEVRPDTSGSKAGLLKNDILMELNGKNVPADVNAFNNDLRDFKQGDKMAFGVIRRGKKVTVANFKLPDAK